MATVSTADINTALLTTLGAAANLIRTQDFDEITEGMQDTPTLQVYPETLGSDVTTNTDRSTFGGGLKQTDTIFNADVLVNQRSNIGEDMAKVLPLTDQIVEILQSQNKKPYFDINPKTAIKAFSWTANRVIFSYAAVDFIGVRFVITIRTF